MRGRRLAVALGAALLISGAARARAEAGTLVVLVRPPRPSEIVKETITRLSAELRAVGFAVRVADGRPGVEGRTQVEGAAGRAGGEDQPFATIAVLELDKERGAVADVWIADHVTEKTLVRRVELGGSGRSSAASDLAVRSVELLRASLLELSAAQKRALSSDLARWLDVDPPLAAPAAPLAAPSAALTAPSAALTAPSAPSAARAGPSAAPVERSTARPPPSAAPFTRAQRSPPAPAAGAMLSAGFGVLANGFGAVPTPVFRAGFTPISALTVRVLFAPGIVPAVVSAEAGDVKIRQTAVALDIAHTFFEHAWIHPMLALGAGVQQLKIDGEARAPFHSEHHTALAVGLTAGAGLGVRISRSLEAVAEIDAIVGTPEPVVTILDVETGRAGAVTGSFTIGLSATF
ncbi:hypothetical protein WMF04_24625 [Sorangium sp. So ce260]|uniref:hypothetical protein n=1 Tax=Sorangium sp. So ce260 TaxID=3133291 RepID=UPI003F644919